MKARTIGITIVVLAMVVVAVLATRGGDEGDARPPVAVGRATITKTAVAVGKIEPEYEITVRSQFAGLVGERYRRLGERVEVGDPLVEIRRETTALDIIQAKRGIEAAERAEAAAREYVEGDHLASLFTRMMFGGRQLDRMGTEAELSRRQAEESLEFLRSGKLRIGDYEIDLVVRAPAAGTIIDLVPSSGERVIPVGSYQPATMIATIADMDHLEFRGTVDEIDVGKLEAGMTAEIRIGALPGVALSGTLREVGLKAREDNNALVFDVMLTLDGSEGRTIRAGYSATAEIFIERRENVLVLPERVIDFRGDEAFVRVPGPDGTPVEKKMTVGLSDGLSAEIVAGLAEGDLVLEKTYPIIE